jgi:hypothetical protein
MKPRSSSWPVAVLFVSLMVGLVLQPAAVQGQQSKTNDFNFSQYSHSEAFPNIFAPYTSPRIPAPKLSNSERLHNLIRNGKLELSLDDAIALALENNLDIDVARYSLRYAQTDLLRTRAGQSFRGINPGLFGGVQAFGTTAGGGSRGGTGGAGGISGGGSAINIGSVGCFHRL